MAGLYFREYTMTTHGWLNVLEVLIGAWLWFLYGTIGTNTGTQQMLYGCALAFTLNGCVFLVSSLLSLRSAVMLPKLFYYTLFHLLAATCYMFGGIRAVGRTAGVDGVTAIVCGGFHFVHFIYSIIKT
ncbi:uncharacterized protein LOC115326468 [Ixodes scapularis]|uniref:uncharacterized protein LOC115326468 n=1 Tax=Ixodes scapularis TaxID=6945 RepID=UPI0011615D53|nr:uncharacterized protein LOC115326468 [Ixodes scapularis]